MKHPLVDVCAMWCTMTGTKPEHIEVGLQRVFITRAVLDFTGEFIDLNDNQRRLIAGLEDK